MATHIHIHTRDSDTSLEDLLVLVKQINQHSISLPKGNNTDNTNDDLNWLKRAVERALMLEKQAEAFKKHIAAKLGGG